MDASFRPISPLADLLDLSLGAHDDLLALSPMPPVPPVPYTDYTGLDIGDDIDFGTDFDFDAKLFLQDELPSASTPVVAPKRKAERPPATGRGTKRTKAPPRVSPTGRVGCSCKRKCQTLYCICFRAGIKCDPELCVKCTGTCCNTTDNPGGVRQERRDFCACRKTKCDKKYCECRLAGRVCGPKCLCNKDCCVNLKLATTKGV